MPQGAISLKAVESLQKRNNALQNALIIKKTKLLRNNYRIAECIPSVYLDLVIN